VGRPELREKLRADVIRQIKQRIVISCRINPLTKEESLRYIDHRCKLSQRSFRGLLPMSSIDDLQLCQRIPLVINTLCSNALSVGCALAEKRFLDQRSEGLGVKKSF